MRLKPETLQKSEIGLLRFLTCGSVDDGKSTLIGRLLFDSKQLLEDQLAELENLRQSRGDYTINLANLTDGLRAEREQGITIDVAHRFFSTPQRRFIVADTPGHFQYTRNMVTAASTCDLAVILIDATKGVIEQTRRHSYLATLLGIKRLVLAVNKIDLVSFEEETFRKIESNFLKLAERLGQVEIRAIPLSALDGDNVVDRSARTPWYAGPALLEYLETVEIAETKVSQPIFPVQWVVNPQDSACRNNQTLRGFRAYAGQVASGEFRVGDKVRSLPNGQASIVKGIYQLEKELDIAVCGQSVMIELEQQLDAGRGSILVSGDLPSHTSQNIDAVICWMAETPLNSARSYFIRHTTQEVRARIKTVHSALDIHSLEAHPVSELALNDIGRVTLSTSSSLVVEKYEDSRVLGAFVLIDEHTNQTVAAGLIQNWQ